MSAAAVATPSLQHLRIGRHELLPLQTRVAVKNRAWFNADVFQEVLEHLKRIIPIDLPLALAEARSSGRRQKICMCYGRTVQFSYQFRPGEATYAVITQLPSQKSATIVKKEESKPVVGKRKADDDGVAPPAKRSKAGNGGARKPQPVAVDLTGDDDNGNDVEEAGDDADLEAMEVATTVSDASARDSKFTGYRMLSCCLTIEVAPVDTAARDKAQQAARALERANSKVTAKAPAKASTKTPSKATSGLKRPPLKKSTPSKK